MNISYLPILEFTIKSNPAITNVHKELDEALRKKVAEYVRKIDVGIKDIVIEKENYKNRNTGEILVLKTVHSVYDDDVNEIGESTLYTLVDLGVKQDDTFDKDYLKGKYGAIPIVQSFFDKGSVE